MTLFQAGKNAHWLYKPIIREIVLTLISGMKYLKSPFCMFHVWSRNVSSALIFSLKKCSTFEVEMFPAIWSPAEALVIERHARRAQSLGRGQTLTQGHPRGLPIPIARIQLFCITIVVLVEPVLLAIVVVLVLKLVTYSGASQRPCLSFESCEVVTVCNDIIQMEYEMVWHGMMFLGVRYLRFFITWNCMCW